MVTPLPPVVDMDAMENAGRKRSFIVKKAPGSGPRPARMQISQLEAGESFNDLVAENFRQE